MNDISSGGGMWQNNTTTGQSKGGAIRLAHTCRKHHRWFCRLVDAVAGLRAEVI